MYFRQLTFRHTSTWNHAEKSTQYDTKREINLTNINIVLLIQKGCLILTMQAFIGVFIAGLKTMCKTQTSNESMSDIDTMKWNPDSREPFNQWVQRQPCLTI